MLLQLLKNPKHRNKIIGTAMTIIVAIVAAILGDC